jgi:small neutral amino acid transporter SnatA (MarC family)
MFLQVRTQAALKISVVVALASMLFAFTGRYIFA